MATGARVSELSNLKVNNISKKKPEGKFVDGTKGGKARKFMLHG